MLTRAISGLSTAGADRRSLTSGSGVENNPVFSPDGKTVAFTGEYDGNTEVFTIPATGGIPTYRTLPEGGLAEIILYRANLIP